MSLVEMVGRRFVLLEIQHGRHETSPQFVGQLGPVPFHRMTRTRLFEGFAKASVPVENRPTCIEGPRIDAIQAHGISTVAPKVVPLSMASWALTASLSAYS